jgi:hypothetical protein
MPAQDARQIHTFEEFLAKSKPTVSWPTAKKE